MLNKLKRMEEPTLFLLNYRSDGKKIYSQWSNHRMIFEKITVERIHTNHLGLNISLERIGPTKMNHSFRHQHFSPLGAKVIGGEYFMERGEGEVSTPATWEGQIPVGSSYEMTKANEWHNVATRTTTHIYAITDKPFGVFPTIPNENIKIEQLLPHEIIEIKQFFKKGLMRP